MLGDGVERLLRTHAGELGRIDKLALLGIGTGAKIHRAIIQRRDHLLDRDTVLISKLPVTLVVGRHRHHCAFAVTHEHEVGDIDRHLFAGDGMARRDAGIHALLFHRLDGRLGGLLVLALVDKGQ